MTSSPIVESSPHASIAAESRELQGRELHLFRIVWVLLSIASLGMFFFSLPYHIIYISSYLPIDLRIALMQYGISPNFYIAYELIHDLIIVLGFSITGLIIYRHKSNDRMTIFISLALITFGVTVTSLEIASSPLNSLKMYQPFWQLPVMILQGLGLGLILLVFYIFPDGHFVPR
jgi:hypothetical protein